MSVIQEDFLRKAARAAEVAGHLFPEYAACEVALESAWGKSRLAMEANNLFGQKQCEPAIDGTETFVLATREFLSGSWVIVEAKWVRFDSWSGCFEARMRLLRAGSRRHVHYAAALDSKCGEDFIREVSETWSTDPKRADKVLAIYAAHGARVRFSQPLVAQGQPPVADSSDVRRG